MAVVNGDHISINDTYIVLYYLFNLENDRLNFAQDLYVCTCLIALDNGFFLSHSR